jgi:hypothetical protein
LAPLYSLALGGPIRREQVAAAGACLEGLDGVSLA